MHSHGMAPAITVRAQHQASVLVYFRDVPITWHILTKENTVWFFTSADKNVST